MLPENLIREVPIQSDRPSWFWKVVAGAALSSFVAVVLLAWYATNHRKRVEYVRFEVPSMCGAPP